MSTKEEIRSSHRLRRAAMSASELDAAGAEVARHGLEWACGLADGAPRTFAAYLGVASEPPTMPLLAALHHAGHRVLLPVCEPDLELSWVYWTPASQFAPSRYAPIQEPVGERLGTSVMDGVTGIVLPATALDRAGNRIGQGGGYYDKFLAALADLLPHPAGSGTGGSHHWQPLPTAAVVYDGEVLPAGSIPTEPFDRKVDCALTPGGVVPLSDFS